MEIAFKSALGISVLGDSKDYYNFFKKCECKLIERMYKRYVNRDDVEQTLLAIRNISNLNICKDEILDKLYESFKERSSLSEKCFQKYGKYVPIRIVLFEEPYCTLSDNIPLEDYDNNDGEPFWMRPKYILDHYSKSNR